MPNVVQIEKYLAIAKKHNLNLSEGDILYLDGFIGSMIKSELETFKLSCKKMKKN